jgi:hypothetical protein
MPAGAVFWATLGLLSLVAALLVARLLRAQPVPSACPTLPVPMMAIFILFIS